jgi:hypothetical protein
VKHWGSIGHHVANSSPEQHNISIFRVEVFYLCTELLGLTTRMNITNTCAFRQQNFIASPNSVSSPVINVCLLHVLRLYRASDLTGCILLSCRKYSLHIAASKDARGKAIFTIVAVEPSITFISGDMWQHGTLCSWIRTGLQFK